MPCDLSQLPDLLPIQKPYHLAKTELYIVNSDEDMELYVNSLYNTADAANAAYTPEDVLNMTAFGNPDATYAGLVEAVQTLTY